MVNLFVQQNFDTDASNMESNGAFGSFLACSFIRDTAFKFAGAGALKVTWPAPSGSTASWVNHVAIGGLTVGRRYRVTAMIYVPPGNPDITGYVAFQFGPAPNVMTTKGAWTQYSFEWVAPNTSAFIGWGTNGPPSAGGICWIDNISVEIITPYTAFLEPELPAPLVGPTPNHFRQRNFEDSVRWIETNSVFNTRPPAAFQLSSTQARTGSKSLKVTFPPPNGTQESWVNTWTELPALTIGRRYRVTMWVYKESGSVTQYKLICLFNTQGAPVTCPVGEWTKLSLEFVATNTAHHLGVSTHGPTAVGVIYTDDWQLAPVLALRGTLAAALAPVTGSFLGRLLRRMVYTVTGWKVLHRRKWPSS